MTLSVPIRGRDDLRLARLMLDVNGTLTNRSDPIDGAEGWLSRLRDVLDNKPVSADTWEAVDAIALCLRDDTVRTPSEADKLWAADMLGREHCALIGNGANDVLVLDAATRGFAVFGAEGTCAAASRAADVACASAADPDLLLGPKALAATLRP